MVLLKLLRYTQIFDVEFLCAHTAVLAGASGVDDLVNEGDSVLPALWAGYVADNIHNRDLRNDGAALLDHPAIAPVPHAQFLVGQVPDQSAGFLTDAPLRP